MSIDPETAALRPAETALRTVLREPWGRGAEAPRQRVHTAGRPGGTREEAAAAAVAGRRSGRPDPPGRSGSRTGLSCRGL